MKKFFLLTLCFIMFFVSLPQSCIYAEQEFLKPEFKNGGVMSLDIGNFSYYYINQESENFNNQTNNTLIRFDYDSGERLILAEDVVDFISNGKTIYYVSGVTHRNQIWQIDCDGTNKKLLYTLSSISIQTILRCENGVNLVFQSSDGVVHELNVLLDNTSSFVNKIDLKESELYDYHSFVGEWHKIDPDQLNGDVILNIIEVKENNRIRFSIDGETIREEVIHNNQVSWNEDWFDGATMGMILTFHDNYIHLQYSRYSHEWYNDIIFVPSTEKSQGTNQDYVGGANKNMNDFIGNHYIGLYGVRETEAEVENDLYQVLFDGKLKRTNLVTGEISVLAQGVARFVTDGQNIYYNMYNEAHKQNEIYYIDCTGQNQKLILSGNGIDLLGCWGNRYLYYEVVDFSSQNLQYTTWMFDIHTNQKKALFNQRIGTFRTYNDNLFYIKYSNNNLDKESGLYTCNLDGSNEILLCKNTYEFNIINNELYYAKYDNNLVDNLDFYIEKSNINGETPTILTDVIRTTLGVCQKIYEDKVTIVNYDYISEKKYKQSDIIVLLDNKKIIFDQQPIIKNGRTLVPLRAIFEGLDATVNWAENTQTVTSVKGKTTISMSIGKAEMYKNGKLITLDVVPQLVGGRTLIPVRAVAEAFDCKVDWDGETRTVIIKTIDT